MKSDFEQNVHYAASSSLVYLPVRTITTFLLLLVYFDV